MKDKIIKHKCLRCEYEWESELERPKTCPRCKSYYWDKEKVKETKEKEVKQ